MGTIEEEIKQQKKFESEHEKAMVNILYTSSWLHNKNAARFKEFDITPEQYNVLRILRGSHPKPLMLGEVTCRMLDKNSNATRLVEKLRLKGLVKRELCPNNRRQVDIVITDKGLTLLSKIDFTTEEWNASLKTITKAEAQELNRILDKLRD
ncbi:MAG TPA: MarR family transcriptional regulator [Chitinophagales bacterium]|nr:MarR family transcriptional regulator [Chitinophagales bacterium]